MVESDEIETVNLYVYLECMVFTYRDLDTEISRRIRSVLYHDKSYNKSYWKAGKSPMGLSHQLHCFACNVINNRSIGYHEEGRTGYHSERYGKMYVENIVRQHVRSKVIKKRSRVNNVIIGYREQKFCWIVHVIRFTDYSLTHPVVAWYPKDRQQPLERPLWW